jgi:hypothetical protein
VTPETTKPSVITAAEFVSGGYAQRVAAGECVVIDREEREVIDGKPNGDTVHLNLQYYPWDMDVRPQFALTVRWLPATDELASLRAQVARYRAALALVSSEVNELEYVTDSNPGQTWSDYEGTVKATIHGIRAALAETEEA